MIRIYSKYEDEYHFSRCIAYTMNADICKSYNDNCDECPYYDTNIQFIQHDIDRIIIETDEDDLDIRTCLYNTPYNYLGCGMVDLDKNEDCEQCRFWYDNIEVIKVKKGELE